MFIKGRRLYKMVHYSKTDTSKAIDVNKRKISKQLMVCHYSFLMYYVIKVTDKFCKGCYNTLLISVNVSNIAITNIEGLDKRCIIWG